MRKMFRTAITGIAILSVTFGMYLYMIATGSKEWEKIVGETEIDY